MGSLRFAIPYFDGGRLPTQNDNSQVLAPGVNIATC